MNDLQYPIGSFSFSEPVTQEQRNAWIAILEEAPKLFKQAIAGFSDEQLDTPYREGGWTVRQVIHHVVDSHMNSYIRFRWALTEDKPVIKAYSEKSWANLPDARQAPVAPSLELLEGLHARWVYALKAMTEADFKRVFVHPESGKEISLERNLALYAWHSQHHLAHITHLAERLGWRAQTAIQAMIADAESQIKVLKPQELMTLKDEVVLVDLRDVRELEREGRIPGAIHAPRGMLEFWIAPDSPYHREVFASSKPFVFYCSLGWRSALATKTAQTMGLKEVSHLAGGFQAWKEAGGEVESYHRKQ